MRSGNSKVVLVAFILAAVLCVRLFRGMPKGNQPSHATETYQTDRPVAVSAAPPTDHQTVISPEAHLIYTKHARCRMDCRHISEADIKEVLREGHINEAKSQQNQKPCPTYAIEDNRNSDGIRLRIVFAKCDNEVKVVTCIDRDDEFACDCK